jgi:hypothetical protein
MMDKESRACDNKLNASWQTTQVSLLFYFYSFKKNLYGSQIGMNFALEHQRQIRHFYEPQINNYGL